jgi:hypothetical protein
MHDLQPVVFLAFAVIKIVLFFMGKGRAKEEKRLIIEQQQKRSKSKERSTTAIMDTEKVEIDGRILYL